MKKILMSYSPISGKGIVSYSDIKAGEIAVSAKGMIRKGNSCSLFAIQIDSNSYVELNGKDAMYVNHSCTPNCCIDFEYIDRGRIIFRALRNIAIGEEITFNYNSTEYDMQYWDCAFKCNCGSMDCTGDIKGFRFLEPIKRDTLKLFLSPYLTTIHNKGKTGNI